MLKTIDTKIYLDELCQLVNNGHVVSTVVTGGSMSPFLISNRDFAYMEKVNQKLKKGDIILYKRKNGNYVMHRIQKVTNNGYYLIGDRQTIIEGPIGEDQISAIVIKVKRKGKILTPKSFTWLFFSKIWIRIIKLRPSILKLAFSIKK